MQNFPAAAALTLALFLCLVPTAQAQMVQIAMCMEGGCSCQVPGTTLADVEMILGAPNPPGAADMTLVVHENEYSWRSQTPAQIDASFGGPGDCPVQLDAPLIPEDGMWRITTGKTDASACPLFSLTGQAVPGQISSETRQINWGGWFSPSKLMSGAVGHVSWTSTGGHSWRGVLVDKRLSDGSGTTGASVIWRVNLVSPTQITGSSLFEYDLRQTVTKGARDGIIVRHASVITCPSQSRRGETNFAAQDAQTRSDEVERKMHSLKKTLIAAMALAASAAPLMAQQQGNPGAHFLENWDLDANGEATLSELQTKRGDVFLTFDSNEDGFIDADEYVYFDEARANDMKANAGGHGGRADRASQGMTLQNNDTDQDGKVSRDEFLGGAVAWMGMLDRNTDGVVTTADFGR